MSRKKHPNPWFIQLRKDVIGDKENDICPDDVEETMIWVLNQLDERQKEILMARYQGSKTLKECSNQFQLSLERIRQVLAKALRKLRNPSISIYVINGIEKTRKMGIDMFVNQYSEITPENLSVRAFNILKRNGLNEKQDVVKFIDGNINNLFELRGLGKKTASEIVEKLNIEI